MVVLAALAVSIRSPDVLDNGALLSVIVGGTVVEPALLVVLALPLAAYTSFCPRWTFVESAKGLACWATAAAFAWAGTNGTI